MVLIKIVSQDKWFQVAALATETGLFLFLFCALIMKSKI